MSDAADDANQAANRLDNVVDDVDDAEETADAESPEAADRQEELDGLRIRQLASLRRSEYRSRSHAIIAMLVCAVAAAQLALRTWLRVRVIGWTCVPILCAVLIPVAAWGAIHFYRRAVAL